MLGAFLFMVLGARLDAPFLYFILCLVYGVFRTVFDLYGRA